MRTGGGGEARREQVREGEGRKEEGEAEGEKNGGKEVECE